MNKSTERSFTKEYEAPPSFFLGGCGVDASGGGVFFLFLQTSLSPLLFGIQQWADLVLTVAL